MKYFSVQQPRQYPVIGWFRFVLASFVLLGHTKNIFPLLPTSLNSGPVAVFLFFVVSGYVIIFALDNYYENRFLSFMGNRFLRIYPMYIACYILSIIVISSTGKSELADITIENLTLLPFLKAITIVGAYMDLHAFGPNGVSWSILIEVVFYFVAGAAPLLLNRMNKDAALFLAAMVFFVLFVISATIPNGSTRVVGFAKFTPFFVLGGALYYATVRRKIFSSLLSVFSLAACTLWMAGTEGYTFKGFHVFGVSQIWDIGAFFLLLLLFILFLIFRPSKKFAHIDRLLGDLTYPLYMIHTIVVSVCKASAGSEPPSGFVPFASMIFLCLLAALALHLMIEVPLNNLRDRIRGNRLEAERSPLRHSEQRK